VDDDCRRMGIAASIGETDPYPYDARSAQTAFTFRMIDCEILCSDQVSGIFVQRELLDGCDVKD